MQKKWATRIRVTHFREFISVNDWKSLYQNLLTLDEVETTLESFERSGFLLHHAAFDVVDVSRPLDLFSSGNVDTERIVSNRTRTSILFTGNQVVGDVHEESFTVSSQPTGRLYTVNRNNHVSESVQPAFTDAVSTVSLSQSSLSETYSIIE